MIVLEISDLVHRQLVSSALESDFRQHLERNVLVRHVDLFLTEKTDGSFGYFESRITRGADLAQQENQARPAVAALAVPVPVPHIPAAPNARVVSQWIRKKLFITLSKNSQLWLWTPSRHGWMSCSKCFS